MTERESWLAWRAAIVILLLLLANAVLAATPVSTFPETAPGKLMRQWFDAFNAGDQQKLAAFAEKHYTPTLFNGRTAAEIGERQNESRHHLGALEFFKVESSSPEKLTAIFRSPGLSPRFTQLTFAVDPAKPDMLTERKIGPSPVPPEAAPPKVEVAKLIEEFEPKLEELTKKDVFSGTVLIAKDGKILWEKASGLQNREEKIPVKVDTRFRIGSMNKMFTSVSIAQLVQAGKLNFSDTIAAILPDYPNQEIAQKITIHQLLTHTSGLGDIFTPKFQQVKNSLHDVKDYLPLFADEPLHFEPGSSWSYSNAGFIVLGLIIEKASGQNYYDYVQQHIYDVAGMKGSGDVPKTEKMDNLAVGYMRNPGGKLVPNTETLPWRGMSAGGGDSTVGDLFRFATALRSYKLVNEELTNTITTAKVAVSPGGEKLYAYGFFDQIVGGHRVVGHGGGAPGMNGQLNILWQDGYVVAALANLDPQAAEEVAAYITERLP